MVVLYVCTLPFEACLDLGATGLLSLARIAAALLVLVSLLYPKTSFSVPTAATGWFLLYLLVYFVNGLALAPDLLGEYLSRIMKWGQLLIIFWITSQLLADERLARRVVILYAVSASLMSIGMLLNLPGFSQVEIDSRDTRVSAVGFNPNLFSGLLAIAAMVPLSMILDRKERSLLKKVILIGILTALMGGILVTGSRGGMAAFVLGVSVFFLPLGRESRKLMAFGMAACVLGSLALLVINDNEVKSRWEDAIEGNWAGRQNIYPAAIEMIAERPLLGWGPVEAYYELGRRLSLLNQRDAHNLFLDLFIETGLLGSIPFLFGMVLVASAAWKARNGFHGVLPLAMLVVLVAGNMFSTWTFEKVMWFVMAFSLAAQAAAASRVRPFLREPRVRSWVRS